MDKHEFKPGELFGPNACQVCDFPESNELHEPAHRCIGCHLCVDWNRGAIIGLQRLAIRYRLALEAMLADHNAVRSVAAAVARRALDAPLEIGSQHIRVTIGGVERVERGQPVYWDSTGEYVLPRYAGDMNAYYASVADNLCGAIRRRVWD